MKRAVSVVLLLSLGSLAAMVAPAGAHHKTTTLSSTPMDGFQEVCPAGQPQDPPQCGDQDGTGTGTFTLDRHERTICFTITWSNIDAPNAGHIHEGAVGVAGPVVVPLFTTLQTGSSLMSCTEDLKPKLITEIAENPANFYANFHNAAYPAGAVRGQLHP